MENKKDFIDKLWEKMKKEKPKNSVVIEQEGKGIILGKDEKIKFFYVKCKVKDLKK